MNRISALLVSCASLALISACSQSATDTPDADSGTRAETSATTGLANIKVVEADSGEYFAWLVTEPAIPIVAVNMAWRGGETGDPEGLEGATGFMTYMMNEGAGDLDSKAFATRMEELNMSFGCSSGNDWTTCSMRTLSENFQPAMELVKLALEETRFDEEPFARAVEQTQVALKRAETDAGTIAGRALIETIYPDHPYARYETPETVDAITLEDVKKQRDRIMARDTLLISVVGDTSEAEVQELISSTFSGLPATSDVQPLEDMILKSPPEEPIVRDLPQPQSRVVFMAPGLKRDDPDFIAAYVANYILGGGGFSARLLDEIREKCGLTYGIYSSLGARQYLGTWSGAAQTDNANAAELIARTKYELHKMATEGPTEKELADAKAYLTGAYPLGFDSNAKIAGNMLGIQQAELGLDYIATRNDKVNAVTLEDVKRVSTKYLSPDKFTFVVVGEPENLDQIDVLYAEISAGERVCR